MARRTALIIVALIAATTLAAGSMSYTSVQADRNVEIAVVDDSNAYLGLTEPTAECGGDGCGSAAVLAVTNRFASEMTVERIDVQTTSGESVSVVGADEDSETLAVGDPVRIGETKALHVNAEGDGSKLCTDDGDAETVTLLVTLSVSTDGAEATRYDKSVTLTCTQEESSSKPGDSPVSFSGCGKEDVEKGSEVSIEQKIYYKKSGNNAGYSTDENGKLVGVVLNDGRAFTNGNYDFENDNCGSDTNRGEGVATESPPWAGEIANDEED